MTTNNFHPGKKIQDYWGPGKKLLSTPKFLDSLKTYDKDNIKVSIIKKIRKKYIGKENFTPEKAANASKAAAGLCKWVLAMEAYDRVAKVVSRYLAQHSGTESWYSISCIVVFLVPLVPLVL